MGLPWGARIRDDAGAVLGAGLLVRTGQVLSCAQAVGAASGLVVDFPALPGASTPARADGPGRTPRHLAVLDLERPVPGARAALLAPVALPSRVCVAGALMRLAEGREADGELVGVHGRLPDDVLGAAATDPETSRIVGLLVSGPRLLRTEAVLRHLPELGGREHERRVRNEFHGEGRDVVQAGEIHGGLHFHHVRVIVTGGSVSSLLRHANAENHAPAPQAADVALDLSGHSVRDTSRRIADRLGSASGERERRTLVVDGIDDSAEPEAVVQDVLAPLARRGLRLVLGFRRDSSAALSLARSLWPDQDADPEVFEDRLAVLALAVDQVAERERALHRHRAHVAARIADPPPVGHRTIRLRLLVSALRRDPAAAREHQARELRRAEVEVEHAARRLRELRGALDDLMERRDGLRGRLEAYRAQAVERGLAEDVALDEPYRRAHDALWRGVCALDTAKALVDAYGTAVRERGDAP